MIFKEFVDANLEGAWQAIPTLVSLAGGSGLSLNSTPILSN